MPGCEYNMMSLFAAYRQLTIAYYNIDINDKYIKSVYFNQNTAVTATQKLGSSSANSQLIVGNNMLISVCR